MRIMASLVSSSSSSSSSKALHEIQPDSKALSEWNSSMGNARRGEADDVGRKEETDEVGRKAPLGLARRGEAGEAARRREEADDVGRKEWSANSSS